MTSPNSDSEVPGGMEYREGGYAKLRDDGKSALAANAVATHQRSCLTNEVS